MSDKVNYVTNLVLVFLVAVLLVWGLMRESAVTIMNYANTVNRLVEVVNKHEQEIKKLSGVPSK